MQSQARRIALWLESGWHACFALCLFYGAAYLLLAARGFSLGVHGDVLNYQYHYHFDGLIGGMNWLVTSHWQRHLLGAVFSAPLHALAPGRADLWYALSLAAHFAVAVAAFAVVDALQVHHRRWLALGISLLFAFDALQTPSTLGFATGTHRKAALFLALIALWAYLRFVRGQRRQYAWHLLHVACFCTALMIYEQSILFFALLPLMALVEDRLRGEFRVSRRWLWLVARDMALQAAFAAVYVYLLLILFPGGNSNLRLGFDHVLRQCLDALVLLFSPLEHAERLAAAAAMSEVWVLILLAAGVVALFGCLLTPLGPPVESGGSATPLGPPVESGGSMTPLGSPVESGGSIWTAGWLAAFGLALALLNILGASPTQWVFKGNERLLYSASVGSAMLILCLCAWIFERHRRLGGALTIGFLAVSLAPGISLLYEQQAVMLGQDRAAKGTLAAIYEAIPDFAPDSQPYLFLLSDADPESDLALHPGDTRFPWHFALRYEIRDFRADAPVPDHDTKYPNFGEIRLTDAGIISPLFPREAIAYDRVVIAHYDSESDTARVLDRVPDGMLDGANVLRETDMELRTNWDLLGVGDG